MDDAGVRTFSVTWMKLTCVRISSIVDVPSYLGVLAAPSLSGANVSNSHNGPILPWLRSLDGLNTHDQSYPLSIASSVTTALTLPGSADVIGKLLIQ